MTRSRGPSARTGETRTNEKILSVKRRCWGGCGPVSDRCGEVGRERQRERERGGERETEREREIDR